MVNLKVFEWRKFMKIEWWMILNGIYRCKYMIMETCAIWGTCRSSVVMLTYLDATNCNCVETDRSVWLAPSRGCFIQPRWLLKDENAQPNARIRSVRLGKKALQVSFVPESKVAWFHTAGRYSSFIYEILTVRPYRLSLMMFG